MAAPVGYSADVKSGTSASAETRSAYDGSGWNINFGTGSKITSSADGAIPQWVWVAAGLGAVLWMLNRPR